MLPRRGNTRIVVVAIVAATALGLVGVLALLLPGVSVPTRATAPIDQPMTPPIATASPTVQSFPVQSVAPSSTPNPGHPVTLVISAIEPQDSGGGVIVGIAMTNHRSGDLAFAFDPTHDVAVRDARGAFWSMRWAEYAGSPTVSAGHAAPLIRGLFVGPSTNGVAWPLDVVVRHVPSAGTAEWQVGQNDILPKAATQTHPPTPPRVPSGPVGLTAANPIPSSQLGGVQVDLDVHNQQTAELLFQFDPSAQVTAMDNLGRPYQVRWAQYDGIVHVPAEASARLARLFLSGPLDTGNPAWITIVVQQVPGGAPMRVNVPIG